MWSIRCLCLLALLVGPGTASAHNGILQIDHYVNADGSGQLIANPGGHEVVWERCRPDAPCERLSHTGQIIEVRDEPAGTTWSAGQDDTTERSQGWLGSVRATSPPSLEGAPRVGELVRPLAARWEGGWSGPGPGGGDPHADWLQLQSCRTAAGEDCVVIVDEYKYGQCEPGGGRYLPPETEGRWLLVFDKRIMRDQPKSAEGYGSPEAVAPLVVTGPGTAMGAFGPVEAGTPRPAGRCADPEFEGSPGAGPTADVREPAAGPESDGVEVSLRLRNLRLPAPAFGAVKCRLGCDVRVQVRQGRRKVVLRRSFAVRGGGDLRLPAKQARRLRPGRARVRVLVDGRVVADRRVRLRRPTRASHR